MSLDLRMDDDHRVSFDFSELLYNAPEEAKRRMALLLANDTPVMLYVAQLLADGITFDDQGRYYFPAESDMQEARLLLCEKFDDVTAQLVAGLLDRINDLTSDLRHEEDENRKWWQKWHEHHTRSGREPFVAPRGERPDRPFIHREDVEGVLRDLRSEKNAGDAAEAVETADYLKRCAEEGLTAVFHPCGGAVWTLKSGEPFVGIGPTLREAYDRYKEARR